MRSAQGCAVSLHLRAQTARSRPATLGDVKPSCLSSTAVEPRRRRLGRMAGIMSSLSGLEHPRVRIWSMRLWTPQMKL